VAHIWATCKKIDKKMGYAQLKKAFWFAKVLLEERPGGVLRTRCDNQAVIFEMCNKSSNLLP
jgi:hypothetical protein